MTSQKEEQTKSIYRLLFTGLTMGTADLVPGVSGGTIALLLGIYDELLYSIKLITGEVPRLAAAGKFGQALKIIPFRFLLPLGLGLLTAVFGFSQIVTYLLDTQPTLVWSVFFGLVLGSAFVVSKRVVTWSASRVLLLALGFLLTFILVGLPSIGGSDSPIAVFFTGAITITAMILPGISGSLIMVLLGQYEIVLQAMSERNFLILAVFAAGAFAGIAAFVRILSWLLKHYHLAVIAFLVGVMAGSLRRLWPWQSESVDGVATNTLPTLEPSLLVPIGLAIVGLGIVVLLERFDIATEHDDIDTESIQQELKEL
jgi:putative membrane protein